MQSHSGARAGALGAALSALPLSALPLSALPLARADSDDGAPSRGSKDDYVVGDDERHRVSG